MIIERIEIADFCEDETTVSVTATANDIEETFHVQTVDGINRSDLGCWITTDSSQGDIDSDDYPDFDIDLIVDEAECFIQMMTTEEKTEHRIDGEDVYLIINDDRVKVVTRNPDYINQFSSSYQREFSEPLKVFDTREEALEYLEGVR